MKLPEKRGRMEFAPSTSFGEAFESMDVDELHSSQSDVWMSEDNLNSQAPTSGTTKQSGVGSKTSFVKGKNSLARRKTRRRRPRIVKRLRATSEILLNDKEKILFKRILRFKKRVLSYMGKYSAIKLSLKAAKVLSQYKHFKQLTRKLTPMKQQFFVNQFRSVSQKLEGKTYTNKNKTDAIALWQTVGSKSYKLLSEMFALPPLSVLRPMLNNVRIQPGISKSVFEILRKKATQMKRKDKLCVLLFNEIAIRPHLDYLPHEDLIVGFEDDGWTRNSNIVDYACVFMLRGIYERWKQPVAFAFCDDPMSAEKIGLFYREIVREAKGAGLTVIASVCDQSPNHIKAIDNLLAETKREASFKGEKVSDGIIIVDGHPVVPLFDPPHLLKNLRDHLLTKDLKFQITKDLKFQPEDENMTAKWSHVELVRGIDQPEDRGFQFMKKLTNYHVVREQIKKTKVSLCAEVFSHTVASYMNLAANLGPLPLEAKLTARLIKFMDDLFDSVNGGFEFSENKPLLNLITGKSPHLKTWVNAKEIFPTMEFVDANTSERSRPPVLDGWYRTVQGFILVRSELQSRSCHSFPAKAFNLDPLENAFAQIKQYGGGNTDPTCKSFISLYKTLLIKNFSKRYYSKESNCEPDSEELLFTFTDFLSQSET